MCPTSVVPVFCMWSSCCWWAWFDCLLLLLRFPPHKVSTPSMPMPPCGNKIIIGVKKSQCVPSVCRQRNHLHQELMVSYYNWSSSQFHSPKFLVTYDQISTNLFHKHLHIMAPKLHFISPKQPTVINCCLTKHLQNVHNHSPKLRGPYRQRPW